MDLIERYVYEVGRYLPRKNRADIQAELRSLLMDTLEARREAAASTGEASEEEVVALLKEFGPPAKMAASYRPESQYLIGPDLFPTFRMVVGIALLVLVIVHVVLFTILLFVNGDALKAVSVLSSIVGNGVSTLGAIVIVFYALQYFDIHVGKPDQAWDPRELPELDVKNAIPRRSTLLGIAFGLLFLVILLVYPGVVGVVVSPGTQVLTDPVINQYLPLIVAALLAGLVVDIMLLWRGRWQAGTRLAKLVANIFAMVVLTVLIQGHSAWIAQNTGTGFLGLLGNLPAVLAASAADQTLTVAMYFVQWGLIIAMIVTVIESIELGYRLFRQVMGWDSAFNATASQSAGPNL